MKQLVFICVLFGILQAQAQMQVQTDTNTNMYLQTDKNTNVYLQTEIPVLVQTSVPRWTIGTYAGAHGVFANLNVPRIRQSSPRTATLDFLFAKSYFLTGVTYIGVNVEYMLNKIFSIDAGVNISQTITTLSRTGMYYIFKENGTNTELIRLSKMLQKIHYIGIPIEAKIYVNSENLRTKLYFIVGHELNFKIAEKTNITFHNYAMQKYHKDIVNTLDEPANIIGSLYLGLGIKIGNRNHFIGNIEFRLASIPYTSGRYTSLSTTKGIYGIGGNLSIQIPIFKNHKITYNN